MTDRRLIGMAAVFLALGMSVRAQDKPAMNKLFSDHMVLQRDIPVPVWGTAKPGTKVTVAFGKQEKTAEADKDRNWMVKLDAMKASSEPAELTVAASTNTPPLKIADILVGDVYLCSGQSNMEWTMNRIRADEDKAKADFPGIRHSRNGNGWAVCSPQTVGNFTAVGFYFGRRIHRETGIPIGLLNNAIGGTAIEPWIAPEGVEAVRALKTAEEKKMAAYRKGLSEKLPEIELWIKATRIALDTDKDIPPAPAIPTPPGKAPSTYSHLYTPHTLPLIPFAIKGMIWYQGESNGGDDDIYLHKMNALIAGLRKVWNQGDFPVYFVQLTNFQAVNEKPDGGDGWAKIRMAQLKSLGIKNTGMAVIIDVGEAGNIHPGNKFDVGERLAQWALAADYGKKDLVCSGPLYKGMKIEGNKIRIAFDHVGKGLMVGKKTGVDPVQPVPDGKLKRFAIAAADPAAPAGAAGKLKWAWADAVIEGDSVVVSSPEVQQPVAVHYAYSANPDGCNLYNKDGLPASPFRTED